MAYGNADTSGVSHFLQAYYELHVGDYAYKSAEPCRQLLRDNARYYQERGQVLLGALRYRFNYIDSNAVRNNQLQWSAGVNSQLLDVAGRNGSPYLLREVVVGAALADTLRRGSANFRLDPASIFTNTGVALTSASIDFNDGSGARACTPGQSVTIGYATAGRKTLRYTFNYADGSQFTTYSTLYVAQPSCTNCRGIATTGIQPCRTESLMAAIAYRGARAQADISYYYRAANTNCPDPGAAPVIKPVIVIDGFDHNDKRGGTEIFNKYLSYVDGGRAQNLGTELRNAGYDVVIMNPKNVYATVQVSTQFGPVSYQYIAQRGGSDYIERNGLALVSLIQELNRQMQSAGSTEKLVVIGPSMGGQIARYALSYMEANTLAHNTRLYIALDSPHNGANIPIGLQRFVKYFAGETEDENLKDALAQIDAPASREMTLQHYTQGTAFAPHPDRAMFVNAMLGFRPAGFPADLRRVAVTNGALNGAQQRDQNGQVVNDRSQAFFLEQKGIPTSTASIIFNILSPLLSLATRTITTASGRVWYAPGQGQTATVARTYKLGSGGNTFDATGAPGSCGLDGAPGGYRSFFGEVAEGNNTSGVFQRRNFYSVRDKAVFIPMLSGLAYTPAAYDNCASVSGTDLVCAGTTQFDGYYGPATANEEHIQLTPGNVDFMRKEILGITPPPVLIATADELCAGGIGRTFAVREECTLPGRSQATTYTWTVGVGAHFSNGLRTATGVSVSVFGDAGFDGDVAVTVRATRTGYTASTPVNTLVTVNSFDYFNIDAQAPLDPVSANNYVICHDELVNYTLYMQGYDKSSIRWFTGEAGSEVPTTYYNGQQFNGSTTIAIHAKHNASFFSVYATATSICTGQTNVVSTRPTNNFNYRSSAGGFVLQIDNNCQPHRQSLASDAAPVSAPSISAYPNPANGSLLVQLNATDAAMSRATVRLYNGQGGLVREQAATGAQCTFATADLPAGIYYLIVADRTGKSLRQHLEIKH